LRTKIHTFAILLFTIYHFFLLRIAYLFFCTFYLPLSFYKAFENTQMKNKLTIFFIFIFILSRGSFAQVNFNYDQITICEGSTFDLLNFQNNEAEVDVGWEIVGWQGVGNTTVQPNVSPSVYTLEYREIANPSQIFTKTLSISLRPKPTVQATPSYAVNTCIENIVELKTLSANNYDDLYWLWIETGTEYRQNDITIVTDYTMPTKQTYKLIATNQHCATIAQSQTVVQMVDTRQSNISFSFYMGGAGGFDYQNPVKGWKRPYCKPLILEDFIGAKIIVPFSFFPNMGKTIMTDKMTDMTDKSPREKTVIAYLNENEYITNNIVCELLSITDVTAKRLLKSMLIKGL